MKTEIEVKFVRIDIASLRQVLEGAGAVCTKPMRMMRRTVFHSPDNNEHSYIRVRDEGDKATFTYKRFDDDTIHGAKELEVVVSDYETTVSLLVESGVALKSVQETKRETWLLDGAEIMIDEWPWLEPFVEIEADSEEAVRAVSEKLGFHWADAVYGAVSPAYRASYTNMAEGFSVNDLTEIRFDLPVPVQFGERTYA